MTLRRPYFFELFTLANLGLVAIVAWRTLPIAGSPPLWILILALGMLPQALGGVALRSLFAMLRRDRSYFQVIRTREWIIDTLRLIASTAVMVYAYGWLKLVVPVLHSRLFDQQLWDFDRIAFFGMSPNVFFLDVFRANAFLRTIDWSYANIFYVSTMVAFGYFLSDPSRRVRLAFANGNVVLWLTGAWLYLLVPSLGPAYRFSDLWFVHEAALQRTQMLQAVLMRNYQNVVRAAAGQPHGEIRLIFGIAAFPSMHVAFQMYVFLWMRRLWKSGQLLFGVFLFAIFLGSIITGWHYLIDGIAGIALALACYWAAMKTARELFLPA